MTVDIITLVLLIFGSAFFSGVESAVISLGEIDLIEIEKSKSKNRIILMKLLKHRERLLSTILIGNNLVNIAASALVTTLAIENASQFNITKQLSITISAIALTLIILIFGEITPKSIAIYQNRRISLWVSPLIYILSFILWPLSYMMELIPKGINRLFHGKERGKSKISEKTVINVVSKGEELGVIDSVEKNLINNVFMLDHREVYPIMTPRTAVFALNENCPIKEVQDEILERQFSRIPVYYDSIDNITGIVLIKDLFRELTIGNPETLLKDLAQKPIFIYETLSLSKLFLQFQAHRSHLAVIVDEFGGMAGIVTLEDVLEELVGEIFDEKDKVSSFILETGYNQWEMKGDTDIVTINRNIKGEIVIDGDYETLQGLIMSKLNRVPKIGDKLSIAPHQFTVINMKQNKIQSVLVVYQPLFEPNPDEKNQ